METGTRLAQLSEQGTSLTSQNSNSLLVYGRVNNRAAVLFITKTQHESTVHKECSAHLVVGGPEASPHVLIIQHLHESVVHRSVFSILVHTTITPEFRTQLLTVIAEVHSTSDEVPKALTWTSKEKYFFKFLMIITKKGSLIPRVACACKAEPNTTVTHKVSLTIDNQRERRKKARAEKEFKRSQLRAYLRRAGDICG
jgi:hypothetical protein